MLVVVEVEQIKLITEAVVVVELVVVVLVVVQVLQEVLQQLIQVVVEVVEHLILHQDLLEVMVVQVLLLLEDQVQLLLHRIQVHPLQW
jgi:hypothetical protein|tara:strand:- start:106 stop:369 length:264 start_codon:yes stop_codon:yes gene_type:complete